MTGDIIFVRTGSLISWLIRKLTNSKWSHVCIKMSDSFIIESDFLKPVKVRRMRYTDFQTVHLDITDSERIRLVTFLLEQTSVKYDYGRIIGILANILGISKNRNLWDSYNKLICSELVSQGLTVINSPNIPEAIVDAVTPSDIANILLTDQVISSA